MNFITDPSSGLQFFSPSESHGNFTEFPLIKWCEQYVTDTFVDIGSNLGAYSFILGKKCKKVFAFEPQKEVFNASILTKCINNSHNVILENTALGESTNTLTLYHNPKTLKSSVCQIETYEPYTITIKTLDSYNLNNIDFLRIDVGGSELNVIKGASQTLFNNNFPPLIFQKSDNHEALCAYLKGFGYRIHPITGYPSMFLASDNSLRKKSQQTPAVPPKFDLKLLDELYKSNDYSTIESLTGAWILTKDKISLWEVWHALAVYYRGQRKYQDSYECANRALQAKPPIEKEYLCYEEISITAFYLNKKVEGYDACERVILSTAPWNVRNFTINNFSFYMKPLAFDKVIEIKYNLPENFKGSSSAIIPNKDGYLMNLRSVNYSIDDNGCYNIRDPENIVRTRNFLLTLDSQLNLQGSGIELIDKSGIQLYPKDIRGLEDIRLFGNQELFCTYLEVNDKRTPQMCYAKYDDSGSVNYILPMQVQPTLECEKNWLPLIIDNEIHIIYSFDPFKMYKLDRDTKSLSLVKEIKISDKNIADFRGSANPIRYKDSWLATIHQVYYNSPRKYFHRFVLFDDSFTQIKYSKIFYFESPNIEYTLSLCHSPQGLLIPYSLRDNCSKIGILSYDNLDALFL